MVAFVLLMASPASAAPKQVIDYFGTPFDRATDERGGEFKVPRGIGVNSSGAGPADTGDVYVVDNGGGFPERPNRVQRFARNDGGTPTDPADDTYEFVSAWGAGVVSGGTDYEICTVVEDCQFATPSGGNGTPAGNGAFRDPTAMAIDQDTGLVYVSDALNYRVSVYTGAGEFVRAFGWDVVESGPGDAGTSYEICVAADGDVCKRGTPGPGTGQVGPSVGVGVNVAGGIAVSQPDGNPSSGTVFLADTGNHRVSAFDLDGSDPSSFGSTAQFGNAARPWSIAVDSRGIVYADSTLNRNEIVRYDSADANGGGVGLLDPIAAGVNEVQQFSISATSGTFRLRFMGETTPDLPYNALGDAVRDALRALPGFGPGYFSCCGYGGPGDAGGTTPYRVEFDGALGATNVPELEILPGSVPLSGGTGASPVDTLTQGETGLIPSTSNDKSVTPGLAIDPDSDGAGPDTDILYVLRTRSVVQEFGSANSPGMPVPPAEPDQIHGGAFSFNGTGLAVDTNDGRQYASSLNGSAGIGNGVVILDEVGPPPEVQIDSVSEITATTATVNATINPNGPPATSYHLEYALDGDQWTPTAEVLLGSQMTPQEIEIEIDPPLTGLVPNRTYQVRLLAGRPFAQPVASQSLSFDTLPAPPGVETTGSAVRTATTAELTGRVDPRGSLTNFYFEYGSAGPCSENPCESTPAEGAGAGTEIRLAAATVDELEPDTTYHYRLVAESGAPGSPSVGADLEITTRASDESLEHGEYSGPPGSDRAWEQVNVPDIGGNPVSAALGVSDSGNRAVYQVGGGTPTSESGTISNQFFAQRPAGEHPSQGWQTLNIYPGRQEVDGLTPPFADHDLSVLTTRGQLGEETAMWQMGPGRESNRLAQLPTEDYAGLYGASEDGTLAVMALSGSVDPVHSVAPGSTQLYDVTSGVPELLSLLPGNVTPTCDVRTGPNASSLGGGNSISRERQWLGANGDWVVFPMPAGSCDSPAQLYRRDLETATTAPISEGPVSGPSCPSLLVRASTDAVYFWTQSRLTAADKVELGCNLSGNGGKSNGDVYRYDVVTGQRECLTCLADSSLDVFTPVAGNSTPPDENLALAEDGSRLYFETDKQLLPGAPTEGIYRLEIVSGALAYVAPVGGANSGVGMSPGGAGRAVSPDGRYLTFASNAQDLNPIAGPTNGGTRQLYRYDDQDRSLVCISCAQNGSEPRGPIAEQQLSDFASDATGGPNLTLLAENGTVAFVTPSPLAPSDANTAGPDAPSWGGFDVYEWRDGRQILVSGGEGSWPSSVVAPRLQAVSPSGHDIFFTAAARYTPDAIDAFPRLYTARIGGGISFDDGPVADCSGDECQNEPTPPPPGNEPNSTDPKPGNPQAPADCTALEQKLKELKAAKRRFADRADRLAKKARRAHGRRAKRLKKRAAKANAQRQRTARQARKTARQLRSCEAGDSA